MKDVLLVYYSRTGSTKKVVQRIEEQLGCDVEAIVDLKNRTGFLGNLCGGLAALFQRQTSIGTPVHDPADYDLVIVGSPVWYGNLVPAVRTWLTRHVSRTPAFKTAFFCTYAGKGDVRAGKKFMDLAKTGSSRLLSLQNSEDEGSAGEKITSFAESIASEARI